MAEPVILGPATAGRPPVEVTITVPGHTIVIKAPEPMREVTTEALRVLHAVTTPCQPERTGAIL